jgi:hypothetical protein
MLNSGENFSHHDGRLFLRQLTRCRLPSAELIHLHAMPFVCGDGRCDPDGLGFAEVFVCIMILSTDASPRQAESGALEHGRRLRASPTEAVKLNALKLVYSAVFRFAARTSVHRSIRRCKLPCGKIAHHRKL